MTCAISSSGISRTRSGGLKDAFETHPPLTTADHSSVDALSLLRRCRPERTGTEGAAQRPVIISTGLSVARDAAAFEQRAHRGSRLQIVTGYGGPGAERRAGPHRPDARTGAEARNREAIKQAARSRRVSLPGQCAAQGAQGFQPQGTAAGGRTPRTVSAAARLCSDFPREGGHLHG